MLPQLMGFFFRSHLIIILSFTSLSSETPSSTDELLANVGGPIWALDWCPTVESSAHQFLAVGVHNRTEEYHSFGRRYVGGKNMIQIWRLTGKSSPPPSTAKEPEAGAEDEEEEEQDVNNNN